MTATQPHNRVSPYLEAPNPLPTLPATPDARERVLADAVFASILTLQRLLTHADPQVAFKATTMILDFEKTRLRHGRSVVGTAPPPPPPQPDPFADCEPLPQQESDPRPRVSPQEKLERLDRMIADSLNGDDDSDDDLVVFSSPKMTVSRDEPTTEYIEETRWALQEMADRDGTGEVVTWEKAERVARQRFAWEKARAATAPPAGPKPVTGSFPVAASPNRPVPTPR